MALYLDILTVCYFHAVSTFPRGSHPIPLAQLQVGA
jgi:hypothetical protein